MLRANATGSFLGRAHYNQRPCMLRLRLSRVRASGAFQKTRNRMQDTNQLDAFRDRLAECVGVILQLSRQPGIPEAWRAAARDVATVGLSAMLSIDDQAALEYAGVRIADACQLLATDLIPSERMTAR